MQSLKRTVTLEDMINELDQTLKERKSNYERLIRIGQLSKVDGNIRYQNLGAVKTFLLKIKKSREGSQTELFKN